jgi:hypothetical protein
MTAPLGDTLDGLALDATRAALCTADAGAQDALLGLARQLTALAALAREGRALLTTRGPTIGPDPMSEPPPARISGATPALAGAARLHREGVR